jgi:hypothetical protein
MRHIYHLIGRLDNRAISWTTVLYSVAEYSWGIRHWVVAIVYLCAALIVDVLEVEGVDVAGDIAVGMIVTFFSVEIIEIKNRRFKDAKNETRHR